MAERSLGLAPVVKPCLPSLFAPTEMEPGLPSVEENNRTLSSETGTPLLQHRKTPAASVEPIESRNDLPDIRQSIQASPAESKSRVSFKEPLLEAPMPSRGEGSSMHVAEPSLVEVSESRSRLTHSPESILLQEQRFTSVVSDPEKTMVADEDFGSKGQGRSRTIVVPHAQIVEKHSQVHASERGVPLLPVRNEGIVAMPQPSILSAAEKTEPTVHISIGRVEVRANIAPASPVNKPRPTAASSLSLGDYLKHGAGKS
jgi:hypothetical protein